MNKTLLNIIIGIFDIAEKFVLVFAAMNAVWAFNIPESPSSLVEFVDVAFFFWALFLIFLSCIFAAIKREFVRKSYDYSSD